MSKPKVSYQEFVAAQMTKYQQHSVAQRMRVAHPGRP
jgi:hypothetical protein